MPLPQKTILSAALAEVGWQVRKSPDGREFFEDSKTGRSQWDFPTVLEEENEEVQKKLAPEPKAQAGPMPARRLKGKQKVSFEEPAQSSEEVVRPPSRRLIGKGPRSRGWDVGSVCLPIEDGGRQYAVWIRQDEEATHYQTTQHPGPPWKHVQWRRTVDTDTQEVLEFISVQGTDKEQMQESYRDDFAKPRNIQTEFWYEPGDVESDDEPVPAPEVIMALEDKVRKKRLNQKTPAEQTVYKT